MMNETNTAYRNLFKISHLEVWGGGRITIRWILRKEVLRMRGVCYWLRAISSGRVWWWQCRTFGYCHHKVSLIQLRILTLWIKNIVIEEVCSNLCGCHIGIVNDVELSTKMENLSMAWCSYKFHNWSVIASDIDVYTGMSISHNRMVCKA
jgi:hypothetical protein